MNELEHDVVKSNALIEAVYQPGSLNKMRLLLAAISQIRSTKPLDHKQEFTITAGALSDLIGTTKSVNYRMLKRAADELMEMVVSVEFFPNGRPGRPIECKMNVVDRCFYIKDEGCVRLQFTHSITPYISALTSHFTRYKARYALRLRSAYGIRLYELCMQWIPFGSQREFEVDEVRDLFALGNKYPTMRSLKARVINPAIKDVNAHTDLHITFGQRKAGRRITHFQFIISRQTPKWEQALGQKTLPLVEDWREQALAETAQRMAEHAARKTSPSGA